MRILVPQGIGDSVWCLFKARDLAAKLDPGGPIDLKVACWHDTAAERRALSFLERFDFVHSVEMYVMPRGRKGPVLRPGPEADAEGLYRYIPDGPHPELSGIDYALIPNAALERGTRLEDWLPEYRIDWDVMDHFRFTPQEQAFGRQFLKETGPYVVFFMASLAGNTFAGHNRGPLWTPNEWVELGDRLHSRHGLKVVVVGTTWDEDYYRTLIDPLVRFKPHWRNHISDWPIAQTYAVVKQARFLVTYQSGIGIVGHYLGVPTAIFWRPKGDSITPNAYVSFEEGMAAAWARPDDLAKGLLLPCIYGRHGVDDILTHAEAHGWLKPKANHEHLQRHPGHPGRDRQEHRPHLRSVVRPVAGATPEEGA